MISLDYNGFLRCVEAGFLHPTLTSYKCLDKVKFQKILHDKKHLQIIDSFACLKERMSEEYYQKVFRAQCQVMHYSSLCFPPYSILMAEDLSEDWLAIVDFHKKHARDHSLHQPLTAYIVAEMLGHGDSNRSLSLPNGENLLDKCVQNIMNSLDTGYLKYYAEKNGINKNTPPKLLEEIWKHVFYRTATLSSLFHDIGYPWQYVHRIGTELKSCSQVLSYTFENAESIISQFGDRMILLPFRYFQYSCSDKPVGFDIRLKNIILKSLQETHGFPGGIAFLSLYDAVRTYPMPKEALLDHFSMEWAALAIMMHDMKSVCNDYPELCVKSSTDPLSAIVSLADFLEEFNRPLAKFTPNEKNSCLEYTHACDKVEIDVDQQGVLDIKMYYNDKGQYAVASLYKKEETRQYFNPASGFINLSSLGIADVQYTPVYTGE